jgi:hypothetical protein
MEDNQITIDRHAIANYIAWADAKRAQAQAQHQQPSRFVEGLIIGSLFGFLFGRHRLTRGRRCL